MDEHGLKSKALVWHFDGIAILYVRKAAFRLDFDIVVLSQKMSKY